MSTEVLGIVITALASLAVATISKSDLIFKYNSRLAKDIKLYDSLPNNAKSKKELLEHIDNQVSSKIKNDGVLKRDPAGTVAAFLILALGVLIAKFSVDNGGWWKAGLFFAAMFIVIGVVGFFQSILKKERDEKGTAVKS